MPANENRKVVISDEASEELAQLEELTGLAAHELVRHAIVLLRLYSKADQRDRELRVVNPDSPEADYVLLQMPLLFLRDAKTKPKVKTK